MVCRSEDDLELGADIVLDFSLALSTFDCFDTASSAAAPVEEDIGHNITDLAVIRTSVDYSQSNDRYSYAHLYTSTSLPSFRPYVFIVSEGDCAV